MDIPNTQPEIWQVDVNGQIYEANFEELTNWIAEGALLPVDKVRRGNLRWLEAGRIPSLYRFFNAKELGIQPPAAVLTTTDAAQPAENISVQTQNFVPPPSGISKGPFDHNFDEPQPANFNEPPEPHRKQKFENFSDVEAAVTKPPGNACHFHETAEPKFVCGNCANFFCKDCPKSFGGSAKICPLCGEMCKPVDGGGEKRFEQKSGFGVGSGGVMPEEVGTGANWFFWIAGLSVVNTLIILSGMEWSFVAGLAVTLFIEGFFGTLALVSDIPAIHVFGVLLEFGIAGLFVLFGFFARRGARWAFLVGMILYGLDGLLYWLVGSFIGVLIHAFALYSLFRGYQSSRD